MISHVSCLRKSSLYTLSSIELLNIERTYKYLYPLLDFSNVMIPASSYKTSEISITGNVFGSKKSRNNRSSYIHAYWASSGGEIKNYNDMGLTPRPGVIQHFLKHTILNCGKAYEHWFAFCEWFLPLPEEVKNFYGKPVELWQQYLFEQMGPASFIPVSRILAKCVHANVRHNNLDVVVLIPRFRNSCF